MRWLKKHWFMPFLVSLLLASVVGELVPFLEKTITGLHVVAFVGILAWVVFSRLDHIETELDAIKPEHLASRLDHIKGKLETGIESVDEQLKSCVDELNSYHEELKGKLADLESRVEKESWELGWMLDSTRRLHRIHDDLRELLITTAKASFAEGESAGQDEAQVRSHLIWRLNYIQRQQLDRIRLPYCGRDEYGNRFEGIGAELLSMDLEGLQQTIDSFRHLRVSNASLGQIEDVLRGIEGKLEEQKLRERERLEERKPASQS